MNPKALNALSARIAKIEAMLENKDAFGASGSTTYGGVNYQGSQFGGIQFGDSSFGSAQPLPWEQYAPTSEQTQQAENYGFGATDMAVFAMQQRIAELELLVAGGSNDTRQSDALDATQSVGDDASDGSGTSGGVPAGFTEIELNVCLDGVATTLTVLGRV